MPYAVEMVPEDFLKMIIASAMFFDYGRA